MKKLLSLVLIMLTIVLSATSCAPETINNNDEIQLIDKNEIQNPRDKK